MNTGAQTASAKVIRTQTKSGRFNRKLVAESIGSGLSYTAIDAFITVFAVNGDIQQIALNRTMLAELTMIANRMDRLNTEEHKHR